MRSRITKPLSRPMLAVVARSCRLMLDSATISISIKVISPTADRARLSAAHDPTPPMPITQTCAAHILCRPTSPYKRAMPPNRRPWLAAEPNLV